MERVRECLHHICRLSEAIFWRIREGVLEGAPLPIGGANGIRVCTFKHTFSNAPADRLRKAAGVMKEFVYTLH